MGKPTFTSWTEPFHDKSGTPDKVKSYMTSSMSRYSLVTENTGVAISKARMARDNNFFIEIKLIKLN